MRVYFELHVMSSFALLPDMLDINRNEKRPTTSLGPSRTEQSDDEEDLTEQEDKYYQDIVSHWKEQYIEIKAVGKFTM